MTRAGAKRYLWADVVRVTAIFLVVMVHTSAGYLYRWGLGDEVGWWAGNFYDSLARVSVPMFVMLSGALLLGKKESLGYFFRHRFPRVLLPWVFWGMVLVVVRVWFSDVVVRIGVVATVTDSLIGGFWFVPMILGLYLLAPLLRVLVHHASNEEIEYLIGLWLVVVSLYPLVQFATGLPWRFDWPVVVEFVGYFVLGWWVVGNKKELKSKLWVLWLLGFVLTFFGTYLLTKRQGSFNGWLYEYWSLGVVLMSVGVYGFVANGDKVLDKLVSVRARLWLGRVSRAAYGMFFVHIILLRLMKLAFDNVGVLGVTGFAMADIAMNTVVLFGVSFGLVYVLQKIPVVGRVVT